MGSAWDGRSPDQTRLEHPLHPSHIPVEDVLDRARQWQDHLKRYRQRTLRAPYPEPKQWVRNDDGGHSTTELYPFPEERNSLVEKRLRTGEVQSYEITLLHKDGRHLKTSVSGHLLYDDTGTPSAIEGTIRDITERKQAEEALSQANKKLNLLSGITRHDLKNKVIVIQGFLELARKSKNIDEILPFLDKIQDSAKAIEHQIDFTKDYQDLGVKSPDWLNLSNMIILASNPAIHFFDETGTLQIFADPLFEKVTYNLVDNTIRHGETATEVHISALIESEYILIIWVDNGVGVPADKKEMIFHRGYGKNNGLGLFLIRKILEITGMTIQENGEPGKGVRFEITVPNGKWRYWNEASLFAADRFGRTHADIRK